MPSHAPIRVLLCLPLVFCALPARAQPDEAAILRGIDAAVQARLNAIASYSVIVHYAVYRGDDHTHPVAQRIVKATYQGESGKSFQILSDSGSDLIRKLVLDGILDNEKRINTPSETQASYVISANYWMKLQPGGTKTVNGRDCYVLSITPKVKATNLIIGTLWVDVKDQSIVQLEGTNSKSVSALTGPTKVSRQYQSINGFSQPIHDSGASTSFLFGQTLVTIDYTDYAITLRNPN